MWSQDGTTSRFWKRDGFAYLPDNKLRMRHVVIDKAVWTRNLYAKLAGMSVAGIEEEAFESLFVTDSKRSRLDVRKLRSAEKGWTMARSFSTDGVTLCVTYENLDNPRTPEDKAVAKGCLPRESAFDPLPDGVIRAGVDPGVENPLAVAWELEGKVFTCVLNGGEHRVRSHETVVNRRREERVARVAGAEVDALSRTRRKTTDYAELRAYTRACNDGHDALWAAFGCATASRDRFELYRYKAKAVDTWLMQLKDEIVRSAGGWAKIRATMIASAGGPERLKAKLLARPSCGKQLTARIAESGNGDFTFPLVALEWGNANFNASIRGCKPVPTKRLLRRVVRAMQEHFLVRMVDEFRTTKLCCACHAELASGRRLKRDKLGVERWVTDRDVKWCTTPGCLGSHPCPAPAALLKGVHPADLTRPDWQPVCRDSQSALAMCRLGGMRNEDRPEPYRRSNNR